MADCKYYVLKLPFYTICFLQMSMNCRRDVHEISYFVYEIFITKRINSVFQTQSHHL